MDDLDAKLDALRRELEATGGVMVAFSGGADSAFLLAAAGQALGDRAVAATGVSPTLAETERAGDPGRGAPPAPGGWRPPPSRPAWPRPSWPTPGPWPPNWACATWWWRPTRESGPDTCATAPTAASSAR